MEKENGKSLKHEQQPSFLFTFTIFKRHLNAKFTVGEVEMLSSKSQNATQPHNTELCQRHGLTSTVPLISMKVEAGLENSFVTKWIMFLLYLYIQFDAISEIV